MSSPVEIVRTGVCTTIVVGVHVWLYITREAVYERHLARLDRIERQTGARNREWVARWHDRLEAWHGATTLYRAYVAPPEPDWESRPSAADERAEQCE